MVPRWGGRGGPGRVGPTHHDVAGLHGVHGGREAVLRLLVVLAVLEREERQAPPGLQQPHRQAWGDRPVSQCPQAAGLPAGGWATAASLPGLFLGHFPGGCGHSTDIPG